MTTLTENRILELARKSFGTNAGKIFEFLDDLREELAKSQPSTSALPAPMPRYSNCGELQPSADDYFEAGRVAGWNDCLAAALLLQQGVPAISDTQDAT